MSFSIETTIHIWREGDQFIAQAMPINVLSAGATPDAARSAVAEAVHLFAVTAQAEGALEHVLEEAGYRFQNGCWLAPEWVAIERHAVAV